MSHSERIFHLEIKFKLFKLLRSSPFLSKGANLYNGEKCVFTSAPRMFVRPSKIVYVKAFCKHKCHINLKS